MEKKQIKMFITVSDWSTFDLQVSTYNIHFVNLAAL